MTRSAPTKIYVEKDFWFWPFYEMLMNHIENIGWITSLVFTKLGIYYKIAKDFWKVIIKVIETDYQALKISTQSTDNIKKLKFRDLFT